MTPPPATGTDRLRVLVGPADPAGVASNLAAGLVEQGHGADVVVWEPSPYGYRHDSTLGGFASRLAFAAQAGRAHDVLHAFGGRSWVPYLDLAAARARRRLCLVQYNGTDVRSSAIARSRHPARARVVDPAADRKVKAHRWVAGRLAQAAIVQDLELATYLADAYTTVYVAPFAIDLARVEAARAATARERTEAAPLRVLHAPSDRRVKGSDVIEAGIRAAAEETPIDAITLSGAAHRDVLAGLARADLVVDQLNCETPGVLAAEAMAFGTPVLCEYDERKLAPFALPTPVVRMTPDTVASQVADLARDPDRRSELGRRGRAYAADIHSPAAAARAAAAVYEHCSTGLPGLFQASPDGEILKLNAAITDRGESLRLPAA